MKNLGGWHPSPYSAHGSCCRERVDRLDQGQMTAIAGSRPWTLHAACYPAKARAPDKRESLWRGAKFHVLTAMEEVVEVPQILGPWSDNEQKSREHDEYTTHHGTNLRTPVHQRSARGASLFHSLSLNLRPVTGFWIFRIQIPRTPNSLPKPNCYRASTAEYLDSRLPTLTKRCLPSSRSWRAVPSSW
jgi:hypothetical protein